MTRSEHMKWCKQRALEYLDAGDTPQAIASMLSDLRKHPDTESHLGMQLVAVIDSTSMPAVRRWIEGFN